MSETAEGLVLKLSCPDRPGLVAEIAGFTAARGGNLLEFDQFTDASAEGGRGRFFARLRLETRELRVPISRFREEFASLAREMNAEWHFRLLPYRMKTCVMVTSTDHCLNEILWRSRIGELPVEITSVIGNQETCRAVVEREGIPFHHIPVTAATSDEDHRAIEKIWLEENAELIVLARYMRVVPAWMCEKWAGRIINIHHSFLPAFVGANPYRRAHDRGVKLIGATCHYVTAELDAGPIIEQEVARVSHHHQVADLVRMGRDCERNALAKGIRCHVTDRILIHGNKAIVFAD